MGKADLMTRQHWVIQEKQFALGGVKGFTSGVAYRGAGEWPVLIWR